MKRVMKVLLFVLSVIILSSHTVFGEIPHKAVVIGHKGYDFTYAKNPSNLKEILDAVRENQSGRIYIKLTDGKWYDNLTKEPIDKSLIPKFCFKDVNGNITEYKAEDVEMIDFKVEEAYFLNAYKMVIKFSLPCKREDLHKNIRIDGVTLNTKDYLSFLDDGRTVIINFHHMLKMDNFLTTIEVEKGTQDNYGNELKEGFKKDIFVINNAYKGVPYNIQSDISILSSNKIYQNLKGKGNLYVSGDNVTLERIEIKKNLILNLGKESKLKLKDSELKDLYLHSGKKITMDCSEVKDFYVKNNSDIIIRTINKGKIDNLKIKTEEAVVILDGEFNNVITDYKVKKIKLEPKGNINKLVLNSKVSVEGNKTNTIGEVEAPKEEFKEGIAKEIVILSEIEEK